MAGRRLLGVHFRRILLSIAGLPGVALSEVERAKAELSAEDSLGSVHTDIDI